MFGLGKYNLIKFNLSGSGKEIPFSRVCSERIDCVAGEKVYLYFTRTANESIHSVSKIAALIPIARNVTETLQCRAVLRKFMLVCRDASEEIQGTYDASKIMFLSREPSEKVDGYFYVGKFMFGLMRECIETIRQDAHAGKYMFTSRIATEILSCETIASLTQYTILNLGITIPPNGEIRLNSDIFTALMGLENILHAYEGDWINLKRDTIQLIVDSGTGGELSGEIIYNERYI